MLRTAPPDFRLDPRAPLQLAKLVERVREAMAPSFDPAPRIRSAWPSSWHTQSTIHHGPGVAVHLALGPSPFAARLVLWLEAPLAVHFVERLLGARSSAAAAHHALNLREAEQGVLAYAVARVLKQLDTDVRVTDVSRNFPAAEPGIVLPFSIEAGAQRAVALCLWLDGNGQRAARCYFSEMRLWLNEELEASDLSALARGDLLYFQQPPLRDHQGKLWGAVQASVEGFAETEQACVEGSNLVRAGASLPNQHGSVRLELAQQDVSLQELADFGSGRPLALADEMDEFVLSTGGATFAKGEFVRHRNRLAVRITEV